MVATQLLVANVPELLAARSAAVEGRFDVLSGLPQMLARPRARTNACLCADAVFLAAYRRKLENALGPERVEPVKMEAV